MARMRRYNLQGATYYLLQRGRSGNVCFFDEACYDFYLTRLFHSLRAYRLHLHSYVLLPEELQLLATPQSVSGVVRLLGSLACDYADYFRNRFDRDSSLTRGGVSLTPLSGGNLVLDCQKYLELVPVLNGTVNYPGEYPWSAYRINAFGGHGDKLSLHPQYQRLISAGEHPFQRYREYIARPFSSTQLTFMEHRLRLAYPLRGWHGAERKPAA